VPRALDVVLREVEFKVSASFQHASQGAQIAGNVFSLTSEHPLGAGVDRIPPDARMLDVSFYFRWSIGVAAARMSAEFVVSAASSPGCIGLVASVSASVQILVP